MLNLDPGNESLVFFVYISMTTGFHLHFRIWRENTINPAPLWLGIQILYYRVYGKAVLCFDYSYAQGERKEERDIVTALEFY